MPKRLCLIENLLHMNKVTDCIFCHCGGRVQVGAVGCVSVFPACVVISFRSVFVQLRAWARLEGILEVPGGWLWGERELQHVSVIATQPQL